MNFYQLDLTMRCTFNRCDTLSEAEDLLFMWIKSGHITKKQYKILNDELLRKFPHEYSY